MSVKFEKKKKSGVAPDKMLFFNTKLLTFF